jgi:hypothetical protein
MIKMTKRIPWLALIALLLVFAGCKGESPTAPPPGGSNPPGGTPPPTGVTLTLTASNSDPLVDSTVVITATVSQDGQPVPNGTAVEFSTTNGTFLDTSTNTTIRTTTNGVATATLTAATAGASRITATVNNVTRTVDVTFRTRPVVPPVTPTSPTITSITPSIGRPAGGETIRITGTNFRGPVRVLFDVGGPVPLEGFVVSRSDTVIEVVTPAVNLGAGQQLVSRVIVITEAGSTAEQRVDQASGFTFRNEQLTPRVTTATPNSGPVVGGTRVSIIGDGFQSPVQVLFGSAEARVIEVRFAEIIVEAPAGRDTSPESGTPVLGPVPITVVNINSQTRATLIDGFRYVNKLQITAVHPVIGSAVGGTDVTIQGTGFDQPVFVSINGIEARPLQVTGTRLLVRTGPSASPCAPGAVIPSVFVTNINNGDTDAWGDTLNETNFTSVAVRPLITAAPGNVRPGESTSITVANPGVGALGTADIRIVVNGRTVIPTPSQITNGAGPTGFTFAVPTTGITFPTIACTTPGGGEPGTQLGPAEVTVSFQNLTTLCTDSTTIVVLPPTPNPCLTEPQPIVTDPALGACAAPPSTTVSGPATTDTITIQNDVEAQPLNINSIAISGPDASSFTISPAMAQAVPAGSSRTFTVSFNPTTVGVKTATATFNTNSSSTPTITVCLEAQANPDPP